MEWNHLQTRPVSNRRGQASNYVRTCYHNIITGTQMVLLRKYSYTAKLKCSSARCTKVYVLYTRCTKVYVLYTWCTDTRRGLSMASRTFQNETRVCCSRLASNKRYVTTLIFPSPIKVMRTPQHTIKREVKSAVRGQIQWWCSTLSISINNTKDAAICSFRAKFLSE